MYVEQQFRGTSSALSPSLESVHGVVSDCSNGDSMKRLSPTSVTLDRERPLPCDLDLDQSDYLKLDYISSTTSVEAVR